MELEKIAIGELEKELAKTELLSPFLNSGDKEPCWDGNIYIYKNKSHSKKNIRRVPVQVKAKGANLKDVKDIIKYPVSYNDLNAFMMDGGTLFIVVYIDKSTGNPLQIYYSELLPIKIKKVIEKEQKTYSIEFKKFPQTSIEKTELLINFHENAQKQASFAGKEIPTIEELKSQGVLEGLGFNYTWLRKPLSEEQMPKFMDGKAITIYAKTKGSTIPIPVQYYENVRNMTMTNSNMKPVLVDGEKFYDGFKVIVEADKMTAVIGSCVQVVLKDGDKPNTKAITLKIKIQGTLKQRLVGMEFVAAIMRHKAFTVDDIDIPGNFTDEEIRSLNVDEYPTIIEGYKKAISVFDSMHISKDLDVDACTESDIALINELIDAIDEEKTIKGIKGSPGPIGNFKIANFNILVACLKIGDGEYKIWDYFGNNVPLDCFIDDEPPILMSRFMNLRAEDFVSADNLNLQTVIDSYEGLVVCDEVVSAGNMTMLELIKAYDISNRKEFLEAASELSNWIKANKEYFDEDIAFINEMQIVHRMRKLTFKEKQQLVNIVSTNTSTAIKLGALILLGEFDEADKEFSNMIEQEQETFKQFPIFKLYRN